LLVAVAVVVLGYALKLVPQVDNARIPIYVILSSIGLYVGLCVPPADSFTDLPAFIRYAFTTIILGAFVGLLAWLSHAKILKRLIDSKISVLNQTEPGPNP
jgi:drug/metabolite transporter (DMT)-like permease